MRPTIQHHRIVSRTTLQHELVTCLDFCIVRGDLSMFGCTDEVGMLLNKQALQKPWSAGRRVYSYRNFRGPSARRSHHETQLPSGVQGAAQYGDGRPQMVPGKAADAPAGRVMLAVGK